MLESEVTRYVFLAFAALTSIIIAEGVYLLASGRGDRRKAVNRRMRLQEKTVNQK